PRNHAGAHGEDVASELGAHHGRHHLGNALDRLQHHIAHETVADNDVDRPLADIVAFHVAVEIQAAFAQQLGRLLDYLVALDDFFADIQQTDSGLATLVQRTDQRSTHDRELQEVLCRTVHVRAKIQHRGGAALNVGDRGGNGGTIDAVQRL